MITEGSLLEQLISHQAMPLSPTLKRTITGTSWARITSRITPQRLSSSDSGSAQIRS